MNATAPSDPTAPVGQAMSEDPVLPEIRERAEAWVRQAKLLLSGKPVHESSTYPDSYAEALVVVSGRREHLSAQIGRDEERCGRDGSTNAECAVWGPSGEMVTLPGEGDTVTNRSTPAQVAQFIAFAVRQPFPPQTERAG